MQNPEFNHPAYAGNSARFSDVLLEQMRRTPWFLVSLAVHVVIAIILNFISSNVAPTPVERTLVVAAQPVLEDTLVPPEPEPPSEDPIVEKPKEVNVEVKETPLPDSPVETEEDDTSSPDQESEDSSPFESMGNSSAIGLGSGGGAFGQRRGSGRGGPRGTGGPPGGSGAVLKGLTWLAQHQSADGRWDTDGFMAHGNPAAGPLCDGRGYASHDVGVTGLALLAFLGAGHTHREGQFKGTVRQGLKWLKEQQSADGCFGSRSDPHDAYGHAIAALAMAEAYGMTRSGIWKGSAQAGINFVVRMQNPYKAWRYGERTGENDVSVTGWMVMALKSAHLAGLDVGHTPLEWAHEFIKEMTDEQVGRTGYTKTGEPPVRAKGRADQFPAQDSESMTAVGMLVRIFAGEDPRESPALAAGAELLTRRLPVWNAKGGTCDMYYWYYGSLAMFQMGGTAWASWNSRLKSVTVDTQRRDGNFAGSWDPVGPWGEDGGRVYSTAVMTLCLEVFYRYRRVFGTDAGTERHK